MEIKFNVNRDKIINAILYICSKLNGSVNIYNCLKIFYEADKYHLNKYGVVITGDKYIAMEHGTVPSATKDILYEKKVITGITTITNFIQYQLQINLI